MFKNKSGLSIQLKGFLDGFIIQIHATLHACHGLHQTGPVFLRQALVAPEAGELAYMADVGGGVVLRGRCPTVDDVPDTAQPVLIGIGAQEAESSTQTPLHRGKLTENSLSPRPPQKGGGYFSFP